MSSKDPRSVALQFNEHINHHHVKGLSSLMTEDHRFIDRAWNVVQGKENMTRSWIDFFKLCPEYRNTFTRVEARGNLVILVGYATWKKGDEPDAAIWTATIENDLVAEWRIHEDTEENKKNFELV